LERYAGWWGDIPWLVGMLAVAGGDSCAGWWGFMRWLVGTPARETGNSKSPYL